MNSPSLNFSACFSSGQNPPCPPCQGGIFLCTKKEREDFAVWLASDPDILKSLEEMILDYAEEGKKIEGESKKLLDSTAYEEELGEFAKTFRESIVEHIHEKKRKDLMRKLGTMCETRNKSLLVKNPIPKRKRTEWEKAYQYATREVQIVEVVQRFVEVKNPNRMLKCPLPEHDDKTASFKISQKDNRFRCFGCGASGSSIDFVMRMKHCSFKEAVSFLFAL
jgi:hypothetical protein